MSSFCLTKASRSKPREAKLVASSSARSSKAMKTPGSANCAAPRARNSMARSVLPLPALPHTSEGRPAGRPPPVTSSRPEMPVGVLRSAGVRDDLLFRGAGALVLMMLLGMAWRWDRRPEASRGCGLGHLADQRVAANRDEAAGVAGSLARALASALYHGACAGGGPTIVP